MKTWSFYPLIVANYRPKYEGQPNCTSCERAKIPWKCHARFLQKKLSREIVFAILASFWV